MAGKTMRSFRWILAMIAAFTIPILGCKSTVGQVPHEGRWGIYALDLATQNTQLIYNADREIQTLRLNHRGDAFVFAQKMDGDDNEHFEINSVGVDGANFKRLTSNTLWDIYPAWSPDDSLIAFLSFGGTGLDIYVMTSEGNNTRLLYDSGTHDADIDWVGDRILYIVAAIDGAGQYDMYIMNADGTNKRNVTPEYFPADFLVHNAIFSKDDSRLSR